MGTSTPNFGLNKPSLSDPPLITQLDGNWDKIDTQLKAETDRALLAESLLSPGYATVIKTSITSNTVSASQFVLANATTASFTITLPNPALRRTVIVQKTDATVNTVTVVPNAVPTGGLINGTTSFVLGFKDQMIMLISDGVNWFAMLSGNQPGNINGAVLRNGLASVTTQSGTTYTLTLADSLSVIRFDNTAAITVTLPNNMPVGFSVTAIQTNTGQVTFAPATGATMFNYDTYTHTAGQYAEVSLVVTLNTTGTAAKYILGGRGA